MTARVAVLVGRPPTAGSVVHELLAVLDEAGVQTRLDVVDGELPRTGADLLVLKDLPPQVLATLADGGAATCNAAGAELRSLDKAAVVEVLRAAGLPVPASRGEADWARVQEAAARGPVVVKPQVGTQGAGVLLLDGAAPATPPVPGPWIVQDRVRGDGLDRKLYVVGDRVDGTLRRWPDRASSLPCAPGPELSGLALAAARALGLEICGVDVLVTPSGPVVVDVNAFPGFKQVPGAAARLGAHVLARLSEEVAVCA